MQGGNQLQYFPGENGPIEVLVGARKILGRVARTALPLFLVEAITSIKCFHSDGKQPPRVKLMLNAGRIMNDTGSGLNTWQNIGEVLEFLNKIE